ncbi:MAG: hypothetical protein HKN03_08140 [Acidimicrobiales bacterium]|nr:hypothetical protein [Acidimicrobiales bacterium]
MPLPVRRTGALIRLLTLVLTIGVVGSACSFGTGGSGNANGGAEVLGASSALPGKYVSTTGNNGNSGNAPDQAYRTLAHAVKQLTPGDTLYVMEGDYFENERPDSAVAITNSGTPQAWITITAFPGATPIIRSNQSNGIKVDGASYVEISNLELIGNPTGGTSSYSGSGINVDAIYSPAKNHHIRILNNTISGFGAGGIPVTGSSHVEIRNNVIHDVAEVEWTQHSGISILESFNMGFGNDSNGYSNYITGNTIYRVENKVRDRSGRFTDGNCIIMDRTKINSYTGRTLIANNLCLDSGGRGVQVYQSRHVDVVNNTIFQNLKTGEIASSGGELGAFYSEDVHFANNLVFARNGLMPARTYDASNIRFTKNLYVGDTDPQYNGAANNGDRRVGSGTAVVASPSTNPNPANFKLVSGSPAVNAGTNAFDAVVSRDYLGAQRPAGGATDIGALESGSSAPVATTAPPTTAAPTTAAPTTAAPTTAKPTTSEPTTVTTSAPTTQPPKPATTVPEASTSVATTELVPTIVPRPPTTASPSTTTAAGEDASASAVDSKPSTAAAAAPSSSLAAAPAESTTSAPATSSTSPSSNPVEPSQESAVSPAPAAVPPGDAGPTSGPATTIDFGVPEGPRFDFDDSQFSPPRPPEEVSVTSLPASTIGSVKRSLAPPSTIFDSDGPGPADGEPVVDFGARERNASEPLAFDDVTVPQAPTPAEVPLGILASAGLLLSYYRPTQLEAGLGRLLSLVGRG